MKKFTVETLFFTVLMTIGVALLFFIFKPYLTAIFIGLVFAIVFSPVDDYLQKKFKLNRTAISSITVFFVLAVIILPLFILGLLLFKEAQGAVNSLQQGSGGVTQFLETKAILLEHQLNDFVPGLNISIDLRGYMKEIALWIANNSTTIVSNIAEGGAQTFLAVVSLFFFLRDGGKAKKLILKWSPISDDKDEEILKKTSLAINSVVKGTLLMAIVQGFLGGIGFMAFGVPSPVLWGFITALMALIPVVGTSLVVAPLVIFLYFSGATWSALGLLIWGFFIVGSIDNILRPKLIERGMNIHPFLILLAVFGGISFFGPIGFLMGPIVLGFVFALIDVYPEVLGNKEIKDA
jgi:predicted PurR-regulated permease PerM